MSAPKPHPPQQRLIVYIDGFNLYHGLKDQFGRSMLWLDLVSLGQSLRPTQRLVAVKYFTAPVLNNPAAQGRQAHYQAALAARYPTQLETIQGRYQSRSVKCVKCGHSYTKYEEKETDVNIATALMTDAALHNMDTAILVSADSDLAPAVRASMKLHPPLFVTAAFPPKRSSLELKSLMPASFPIGSNKIKKSQLPAQFTLGGASYQKPSHWN